MYKTIQLTLTARIATPAGAAIVSLTRTRKTHTATSTSYAITGNDEFLRALRPMAQQNARIPLELPTVFAKPVDGFV